MSAISQLGNQTSFEAVIEATQIFLTQIEAESLEPTAIANDVAHLLSLEKGPRGFFASLLTSSGSLADQPPESVLDGLRAAPNVCAKLLTQNLAMSTAMMVFHQRQDNFEAKAGSVQVQQRSQGLIQRLKLPEIREELTALQSSINRPGKYSCFLDRWGYDAEQRNAIATVVKTIIEDQ